MYLMFEYKERRFAQSEKSLDENSDKYTEKVTKEVSKVYPGDSKELENKKTGKQKKVLKVYEMAPLSITSASS